VKQKRVHPNHPNPTSYGPEIVTTSWQVAFKMIFNSKSMQPGWKKPKTACANNAHRTTFIVLGVWEWWDLWQYWFSQFFKFLSAIAVDIYWSDVYVFVVTFK